MALGRDLNISVISQHEKMFPDMDTFYFLEPTQKDDEFELYFTHQNKEVKDKSFTFRIAVIYQYETARIIMNQLNENLKKINVKV